MNMNKLAEKFKQEFIRDNNITVDEMEHWELNKIGQEESTELCDVARSFEVLEHKIGRPLSNPWGALIEFSHRNYNPRALNKPDRLSDSERTALAKELFGNTLYNE